MVEIEINAKLQDEKFRFVLVSYKGKIPIEKDWTAKNNYPYDHEKVKKHSGNIGVATGDGLIIFDCDVNKAEELARMLPETFVVGTSYNESYRKKHFYFFCDLQEKIILESDEYGHLGEIQARGQQCLIPGSIHPSGIIYSVLEDRKIASVTKEQLLEVVGPYMKGKGGSVDITDLLAGAKEGNRNQACFELANYYRRRKLSEEECLGRIREWNKKNIPEMVDDEIRRTIGSVYSKDTPYKIRYNCNPDSFFQTNEKGRKFFVSRKLAEAILEEVDIKTLRGSGRVYHYDDGIYKEGGEERIRVKCMEKLSDVFKINYYNETLAFIQGLTYIEPNTIDSGWINMKNGLYNINTHGFTDHTPDIFTIKRINVEYNPEADCPLFKEKLTDKISFEMMQTVQEMFGYCFLPGQKFEVAFLFYGPPRTMKSTTLYALAQMLGDDNMTSFELQYLTDNQFALAYLFGVPANICADLSSKALKNTSAFMTLVGGDKITAARKHEHPITFYPSTKLVFSANVIPSTANKHLSFYRRWVLLNFPNQTDKDDIDIHMKEKIDEELSGIFNWSMDGMKRLMEFERFTHNLSPEDVKDLYEKNSDTIQSFIYNMIDTDDDEGILTKRKTYKAYLSFCNENELQPENVIKFGRWFKEHTGCGTCKYGKIPAYSGVKFKEEDSPQKKLG